MLGPCCSVCVHVWSLGLPVLVKPCVMLGTTRPMDGPQVYCCGDVPALTAEVAHGNDFFVWLCELLHA